MTRQRPSLPGRRSQDPNEEMKGDAFILHVQDEEDNGSRCDASEGRFLGIKTQCFMCAQEISSPTLISRDPLQQSEKQYRQVLVLPASPGDLDQPPAHTLSYPLSSHTSIDHIPLSGEHFATLV